MNMLVSTPSAGRVTKSALHFAYFVIDNASIIYPPTSTSLAMEGLAINESASMNLVRSSASRVGVEIINSFDSLQAQALEQDLVRDPIECFRIRGALLFKNRGIAISIGDGKRVVEAQGLSVILRPINIQERVAEFWDNAILVPGMMYA